VVTDDGLDLSHLHPDARAIGRLPAGERVQYARADRWIGYTRAAEALGQLEALFTWPTRQRMSNLLLTGPTNNGKSMIIEKFRRSHPPVSHPDREEIPVLAVQMPSDPSVSRFYTVLLAATGAPVTGRQSRLADLEQVTLRILRAAAVRVLVIDELHNVLGGRSDQRREFLNLIRFLGNELRIPLVGVGTREAYLAIRSDPQLENRFAPFTLPRWEPGPEACSLLASFATSLPLRRPSHIATAEMAAYLLARSEGTIGELAALLTDAAVAAIESGEEAISQRTLLVARLARSRKAPARRPHRLAALRGAGLARAGSHASRRRLRPAAGRRRHHYPARGTRLRRAARPPGARLRRRPAAPRPVGRPDGRSERGGRPGPDGPRHRPAAPGHAHDRLPHPGQLRGTALLPVRHRHPGGVPPVSP
jgi:hypothetical protein